jgi:hypothetical protein
MVRRLFTLTSAISLLLCVASAAFWLFSYGVHARYIWHAGHDSWGLVSCDGLLQLKQMRNMQGYGFEEG